MFTDPDEEQAKRERYRRMLAELDDPGRPFAVRPGGKLHLRACRHVEIPDYENFAHGGQEWRALTPRGALDYLRSVHGQGTCRVCQPVVSG